MTGYSLTLPNLTSREQQVLALVADGLTNTSIARRLEIGPSTVKKYVDHILTKLEAHDRAHAVAIAFRTGVMQ
jgi:DNA-binding NarL/FixJ family response regulator